METGKVVLLDSPFPIPQPFTVTCTGWVARSNKLLRTTTNPDRPHTSKPGRGEDPDERQPLLLYDWDILTLLTYVNRAVSNQGHMRQVSVATGLRSDRLRSSSYTGALRGHRREITLLCCDTGSATSQDGKAEEVR